MKLLALDCETTLVQLKFDKIRDAHNVPDLVCISWCDGEEAHLQMWNSRTVERGWRAVFEDPEYFVVGHNLPFDLGVLLKEFPGLKPSLLEALKAGRILDTMVLARLRQPCRRRFSLDVLAKAFLEKELKGKGDIQLSFERDRPLTPAQKIYALEDATTTLELAEYFRGVPLGTIHWGGTKHRHEILCEESCDLPPGVGGFHALDRLYSTCFVYTRLFLEPGGWDMNLPLLEKKRNDGLARIELLSGDLAEHGLIRRVRDTTAPVRKWAAHSILPRKWTLRGIGFSRRVKEGWETQAGRWQLDLKAIRGALEAAAKTLGLTDAPLSAKTQQISTVYDYWKQHREALPRGLQVFLDYARAVKYEGLFFKSWAASRSGRAYPTFFVPGTETLRHASSRPNFHQVPKALRKIFHVKDHVIVGADYSAMETYALCHVMGAMGIKGPLYNVLECGGDIHCTTAALFLGGAPEDYPGTPERQYAKILAHGIPGGLGVKATHRNGVQKFGLSWTLAEARELCHKFKERFWDISQYLDKFKRLQPWDLCPPELSRAEWFESLGFEWVPSPWDLTQALDGGRIYDVVLPCGARLPARFFTQAANCTFQTTGGVVVTRAVNLAVEAGLPVVAAVHDAIYLAVKEDSYSWRTSLESCMEQALNEVCPGAPPQKVVAEVKETFF